MKFRFINSATAAYLARQEGDHPRASREENNDDATGAQKKRKRWKVDGLKLRRKRKPNKARQALLKGARRGFAARGTRKLLEESNHEQSPPTVMVMESLYQAEQRTGVASAAARDDEECRDDDGSGVECLFFAEENQEQPSKKLKLRSVSFSSAGSSVSGSEENPDGTITISEVKSLATASTLEMGSAGSFRISPHDLESVLSVWSAFHGADMLALFEDIGDEEEVEIMLVEQDIVDLVMEKPGAFSIEEKCRILGACAQGKRLGGGEIGDLPVIHPTVTDDASDVGTEVSLSGVSSLSFDSVCQFPVAITVARSPTKTCNPAPAVNPWAAAKRGDIDTLRAIAETHDPSIWATEDASGRTPLQYACQSNIDRQRGPELVLFMLEQWPSGHVPTHVLETCLNNVLDNEIERILQGDENFICEVRERTLAADEYSGSSASSMLSLPLLALD